ncbi:hypothetical protein AOLI_G00012270 [Acnodon oligacanthus]
MVARRTSLRAEEETSGGTKAHKGGTHPPLVKLPTNNYTTNINSSSISSKNN